MEIFFSAETNLPTAQQVAVVCGKLRERFKNRIVRGGLQDVELALDVVPIIVSEERKDRFPERTSVSIKNRTICIAPQLSFESFWQKSDEEIEAEYLDLLRSSVPELLKKLSYSSEQEAKILSIFDIC